MLRHDHSYQISVSVKNVGLLIGPLSVKSKDPGSLCKDSLFYWKKASHFFCGSAQTFSGFGSHKIQLGSVFVARAYGSSPVTRHSANLQYVCMCGTDAGSVFRI